MKTRKVIWKVLRSALMVFGIIALLGVYIFTVSDLPSRVYTDTQQEFLAYNQMRAIRQIAPTLNFELADSIGKSEGEERILLQLPWQKSKVKATLKARFEEEGGVSVAVYDLTFSGEYDLTYTGDFTATVDLFFPFPANLETYHEVSFLVGGQEPEDATYSTSGISWRTEMAPGDSFAVVISYQAEGASSFSYGLVQNQRTDIDITVDVLGLQGSEVAKGTLPESSMESSETGESWAWHYDGLIADRDIRLNLPKRLNFAQRVAAKQSDFRALGNAAPLLVGLFLAVLSLIFRAGNIHLRLESFLLIGLGTVLFFPLLTFMSAAFPQVIAAILAFGVVAVFILLFVKRATGDRTSVFRTGLMLTVFLGLFAIGIISPWQGLFFTFGGLVLVGTFMAIYAGQAVKEEPPTPPDAELGTVIDLDSIDVEVAAEVEGASEQAAPEVTPVTQAVAIVPVEKIIHSHCPHCARALEEDYDFCPGCGRETKEVQRCGHCGYLQVVPDGIEIRYCVKCGELVGSLKPEV